MRKRLAVAGLVAVSGLLGGCADEAQNAPSEPASQASAGRSGGVVGGASGAGGNGGLAPGAGAGGGVLLPDESPPSGESDPPDASGGASAGGGESGAGGAAGQSAAGGAAGTDGAGGALGASGAAGADGAGGATGGGGATGAGGGGGKGGSAGSSAGGKGGAAGKGGTGGTGTAGKGGTGGTGTAGKGGSAPDPAIITSCNAEDGWPDALRQMECNIVKLTNDVRKNGTTCKEKGAGGAIVSKAWPSAPPLALHRDLRESSRAHSVDMGKKQYFSHTSQPGGQEPDDRMKAAGYQPAAWSENIAAVATSEANAKRFVDEWLASTSGHCSALMSKTVTQIGVGVANGKYDGHNMVFATQNFGRPKN